MSDSSIPDSDNIIFLAEATGWKIDSKYPNHWIHPKTLEYLQGGWKDLPNPWTSRHIAFNIIETLADGEGYKLIISEINGYYEIWLSIFKINDRSKGCIGLESLSASITVTIMACLKEKGNGNIRSYE